MPIGQILIQLGYLDPDGLSQALSHQSKQGARLGTNIIELGLCTQDQISQGLSRLHGFPAALEKHFTHSREVASVVDAKTCQTAFAAPIAIVDNDKGKSLVICFRDPWDRDAVESVQARAGMPLILSVAPELTIAVTLYRFYKTRPAERFLLAAQRAADSAKGTTSSESKIPVNATRDVENDDNHISLSMQLVDLDHQDVVREANAPSTTNSNKISFSELRNRPVSHAPAPAGAAIPTGLAAASALPPPSAPEPSSPQLTHHVLNNLAEQNQANKTASVEQSGLSFTEAEIALSRSVNRGEVTEALIGYMQSSFGAGLIAIAKKDMALGHKGFGGNLTEQTVESVLIPLSSESMFQNVVNFREAFIGSPPESGKTIQSRFFKLFPNDGTPEEVLIAPVCVKDKVVCLAYAHGVNGKALAADRANELIELTKLAGQALMRVIRSKKSQ